MAVLLFMLMILDFLMYALYMRQDVNLLQVLDAFAKLPKETTKFVMSVRLFVRMQ
jgi:hypothetical protein